MSVYGPIGAVIAGESTGSGKTTITLGLLRYFARSKVSVSSFKVGPDYIDPGFHTAACGRPCYNIDSWAMRHETVTSLYGKVSRYAEVVVGEGVMGLFDGASGLSSKENGSTYAVAEKLGLPIILVVDASSKGQSIAATVHGFATFYKDINIAGVILNKVSSPRHQKLLLNSLEPLGITVLGCIPREKELKIKNRHLGLIQASEITELEHFLDIAADLVSKNVNIEILRSIMRSSPLNGLVPIRQSFPPLGSRVAVANDEAFQFCYRNIVEDWQMSGAEIHMFSPLNDEAPNSNVDAIYLPGGYPELYAGRIAGNNNFLSGLRSANERGVILYGECGGYMVLGDVLIDSQGFQHRMAGLLPVQTSFFEKHLTLGYRNLQILAEGPLGSRGFQYRGHEFHYATIVGKESGENLFQISDAKETPIGRVGIKRANTMGSFIHLIDRR